MFNSRQDTLVHLTNDSKNKMTNTVSKGQFAVDQKEKIKKPSLRIFENFCNHTFGTFEVAPTPQCNPLATSKEPNSPNLKKNNPL